jgi:NTE family protein
MSEAAWIEQALKRIRAFAYAPERQKPPERPKFGLALGGGFARGIAHLGVLRVLRENNVPIDYLAGTSVGALVATAYAAGSPLDEIIRVGCQTRFKDFAEWTLSWQGFAADMRLKKFLNRLTPLTRFDELRIPLAIAATDLTTAEAVYFTEGEIGPALCASCAYPGLFRPVEVNGRTLVDGFLTAPVPVDAVRRMGAGFVIAVYLPSFSLTEKPTNLLETVSRSFSILLAHTQNIWRPLADVTIEPDVSEFRWDDFVRTPDLVAAGERAARAKLPHILQALRELRPEPILEPASS